MGSKVALVVMLAQYFSSRAKRQCSWRDLAVSGAYVAALWLVNAQLDLGGAALLVDLGNFCAFAGIRWTQVMTWCRSTRRNRLVGVFQDYQKDRVLTLLIPRAIPRHRL